VGIPWAWARHLGLGDAPARIGADGYQHRYDIDPATLDELARLGKSGGGRIVTGAPPLDPARVRQVGLMIADRQAGPFSLAVRSIRVE